MEKEYMHSVIIIRIEGKHLASARVRAALAALLGALGEASMPVMAELSESS